MQLARPLFATNPKLFGKGPVREVAGPRAQAASLAADLKLFAATFIGGFLFVSVLIG
jgi:hypothetical protein